MTSDELYKLRTTAAAARANRSELDSCRHLVTTTRANKRLDSTVANELINKYETRAKELEAAATADDAALAKLEQRCQAAEAAHKAVAELKRVVEWLKNPKNPLLYYLGRQPFDLSIIDPQFVAKQRQSLLDWATNEVAKQQAAFDKL